MLTYFPAVRRGQVAPLMAITFLTDPKAYLLSTCFLLFWCQSYSLDVVWCAASSAAYIMKTVMKYEVAGGTKVQYIRNNQITVAGYI